MINTNFEEWFKAQDFYTNMRFSHGDRLFDKDGDVYRVLPVQMAHAAYKERPKPELGAPFDFNLLDFYKEKIKELEKNAEINSKYKSEQPVSISFDLAIGKCKCIHFSTTMFDNGKATCFDCGEVVYSEK